MRKALFLSVCLSILSLRTVAQTLRVTGVVLDERRRPVPYASVALPDGSAGTATNEVGEFSLVVPALPQRLVVLSIGYARTEVAAPTAAPLTITLPVSAVQLPEVVVRNPQRVAEELVQRAYAKLARHQNDTYYGKAFYRQKTRNNATYDEFFDAFYDVKLTPEHIEGWDLGESRYAFTYGRFHFVNFSVLMRQLLVFTPHPKRGKKPYVPLAPNALERFTFTLREVVEQNGRETAVIDFQPKPGLNKPAAEGTLYLDLQSAALRRQEYRLALGNILSLSAGFELASDTLRLTSDFVPVADSLTRLSSIRGESTLTFRQVAGPPERSQTSAYLLMYHYTGRLPGHTYKKVKRETDDLSTLEARPYDAQFWLNNVIIRASPVEQEIIRSFENRHIFGRL